jgi:hypothetical protein
MVKTEFKPMTWLVMNYDCNADQIKYHDVLKCRENFIKMLKKKCATKEEFSEKMRREMMWSYWSKCQWELIIEIDDNGHIWLNPWVGCREPNRVRVDVTDREDFDWRGFSDKHIDKQIYKNKAKVDVWDQLEYRWVEFIDYCWEYRHKYQRAQRDNV